MRKIFVALCLIWFVFNVRGEAHALIAQEKVATNVVAKGLYNQMQIFVDNIEAEVYETTEEKEYVQRAKNLNNKYLSNSLILSFYAEKVQLDYLDDVLVQMREKSEQTGRQLKQNVLEYPTWIEHNYWLDRGEMDSENCVMDVSKRQACDYPDGYEEFHVIFRESIPKTGDTLNWFNSLVVFRDDRLGNKANNISFDINSQIHVGDDIADSTTGVNIVGQEERYDESRKNKNDFASDVREGMFIKGKETKGLGVEMFEMDTSKVWKSQKSAPDVSVFSVAFDAADSISVERTDK